MDAFEIFVVFLRASALSLGGQTALPLLRQDLVATGLITDQQLVESLAIGRLGTGPGGLYMVSLGYFVLGWAGAVLALVASSLPPLVVIPATTFLRRQLLTSWAAGLVRGLALCTSGLVLMTSVLLLWPSASSPGMTAWWQLLLVALGTAAAIEAKRHPVIVIAVGAMAGLLLGR